MKKPMNNSGGGSKNLCQTPDYALDPLLPYLPGDWTIWEPACGEGYLAQVLRGAGHEVITSDILTGQNFFDYRPNAHFDAIVTNPPYNPNQMKADWVARCYELGKPWANLMPVETIGSGPVQEMFVKCGVEIIYMNQRVNFKMPFKGWGGKSQFSSAWFTWGLGIGRPMTFASITLRPQGQLPLFRLDDLQPALLEV